MGCVIITLCIKTIHVYKVSIFNKHPAQPASVNYLTPVNAQIHDPIFCINTDLT